MRNDLLLLILIIIFIYILLFSYYFYRKREGWGAIGGWVEDNIVDPILDTVDWFLAPGQDLLDSIGELPNDIAEGVKEIDKIIDKMDGFTDDIEDAMKEVGKLTNFPITFANEFGNEAANILNLVEEEAKEASNFLKDSVMSSFNVIQESVTTLSGEALNMITSIFARLGEIISELFFMVLNTLKTVFESFGEDIANGFNEYLVSPLMQIFDTIGELFLSVFDKISVIATWIINIPYCVPLYIFDTMKDQIRDIIPNPILFLFDIFYIYMLVPLFNIMKYILRLFGFNFKSKNINCYPWK